MQEIEVKAKIKNISRIKSKLENLGCKFGKPLIQKDKIFIHKNIQYPYKDKEKAVLRIRKSNGKYFLTLKKNKSNELDCLEKETQIINPEKIQIILELMGYRIIAEVSKERYKCKYKDLEICLDKVKNLGNFIEIEKIIKGGNGKEIQKQLFKFLKTIGIKEKDQVFKGYDTLIEERKYLKNNKISLN